MIKNKKIALVHDYLTQYGGAEKVLEAIMDIYPDAPIYTGLYEPKKMTAKINARTIVHPKNPLLKAISKFATLLMPFVFEDFDLRDYDLVISDGNIWSQSVLTTPLQTHIHYNHSPARFLYKYSGENTKRDKWYFKPLAAPIYTFLRIWDYVAAQRPDFLICNSNTTKERIKKFHGREATTIFPPVDKPNFDKNVKSELVKRLETQLNDKPYYLALGRVVIYKNFDKLAEAFKKLPNLNLVIAGDGPVLENIKELAGPNVYFTGWYSNEDKFHLIDKCKGVINTVKDEDFGIVPIEAMMQGKPVLSHRSGGALEYIEEGVTGAFYDNLTPADLVKAVETFDNSINEVLFDEQRTIASVDRFSTEKFKESFTNFVEQALNH